MKMTQLTRMYTQEHPRSTRTTTAVSDILGITISAYEAQSAQFASGELLKTSVRVAWGDIWTRNCPVAAIPLLGSREEIIRIIRRCTQ